MDFDQNARRQDIESTSLQSAYDPLEKLAGEQPVFNDTWVGKRRQTGVVQRLGFLILSIAFTSVGMLVCTESFSLLQSGVVFMFGIGAFMALVGIMGLIKVIRN